MYILKNEEGIAFLFILILIVLLGSLTLTLFNNSFINLKLTENIAGKKKANYAAEAGLDYGRCVIEKNSGIPTCRPDNSIYNEGKIYLNEEIAENTYFKIYFTTSNSWEECYVINALGFYQDCTVIIWGLVDVDGKLKDYKLEFK